MAIIRKQDALDYHSQGRRGKIEVVSTKPCATQHDLSLAYTPGVAIPCLEIAANPADGYKYTAKGNLVAVVSNGTSGARARRYRSPRRQTCHGRERGPLQEVRGRRRVRY